MAPNNPMNVWGNEKTMNLNTLILTNIQSSPYFKVQLFELKTFHEVVDEIYYRVEHLEPWEKGSRKTAGQTGMCGGVRGVGAGGIVSSAYCLLYKLFTLKLTKKQVNNLITHRDSPFIRGLGFMYIRYTQNPQDLWEWYEPYLDDDEELDVKAGGGHVMAIGEMLRQWLVKLEWYATLFPRIPVPIQKEIDHKMRLRPVAAVGQQTYDDGGGEPEHIPDDELSFGEAERAALSQRGRGGGGLGGGYGKRDDYRNGGSSRRATPPRRGSPPIRRSPPKQSRSPRRSPPRRSRTPPIRSRTPPIRSRSPRHSPYSRPGGDFSRELERERNRQRREREREEQRQSKGDKHRHHSKDRERKRSRSRSTEPKRSKEKKGSGSYEKEHKRSGSRERKEHSHKQTDHKREEKKKKKHKDKDRERERKNY